jgi:hypothetical protein
MNNIECEPQILDLDPDALLTIFTALPVKMRLSSCSVILDINSSYVLSVCFFEDR